MSFGDLIISGVGLLIVLAVPVSMGIGLYLKGRRPYWQSFRVR